MATQRDVNDFQKAQQGIITGTNVEYWDQARIRKEEQARIQREQEQRQRDKTARKQRAQYEKEQRKRRRTAKDRSFQNSSGGRAKPDGETDYFSMAVAFLAASGVVYLFVRSSATFEWWGWIIAFLLPYSVTNYIVSNNKSFRTFLQWTATISLIIACLLIYRSS